MHPDGEPVARSFVFPVRVYYEDTDAAGVVYYASYLRFLERARTEWLRALGVGQERLRRDTGLGFAVRALEVEYLHAARLDDALEVVSSLASVGRAQLAFDQRVLRAGEALVTARVRVACLDLARMKPAGLPPQLRTTFTALL